MTENSTHQPEPQPAPQAEPAAMICPECHAGVLRLRYLTYFTWLNQELITVPNFPSWVCDVCGRREYDARAINWLNTLLHPSTGQRPIVHHKNTLPRLGRPQP